MQTQPYLITGPCSAESEEQVFKTAQELLALNCVDLFRAGVFKPRTRPGNFEGNAEAALEWLKNIQTQLNLPTCTEVATPKHVESTLKYNITSLWIGTRTTASPFAIQELAQSLKGTQTQVLIKNPINPDINLWIGAIERFLATAPSVKLSLIHRGFSVYPKSTYRYEPIWEIAQKIKQEFPELKLYNDPSHMAGDRTLLKEIVQKAKSLDLYDGYMIETHLNPEKALTDQAQQITPDQLKELDLR